MASSVSRKRKCELAQKEIEDEKQLVDAAIAGNLEEVKFLLEANVCPDASEYNKHLFYQSENYMTPLQIATGSGHRELLNLLIEYGADVDAKDRFDVTALHMASELGHQECLQSLLDGGADCNISTKYSKHGSYTAVPHPGGTTPLHLAAINNHVKCVRLLIWNGADYNAVDERCRTSLFIAAQKDFAHCVHAHLDNAIWRDILSLPVKGSGDTPLHECVKNAMLTCVQALLRRGSDVNHKNVAGYSPLHLAVMASDKYCFDIVKALVTDGYNTNVNLPESNHFTALHYVCFTESVQQERRPEAACLLLAHGANYNIRNKLGDNVLQNELRSRHNDLSILRAIAKCTDYLPSLETLGLGLINANLALNVPPRQPPLLARLYSERQFAKLVWYRDLLKEPRSLQHYCRCSIRNSMGYRRLRDINSLPLPTTLKEYLLLQHDEFR